MGHHSTRGLKPEPVNWWGRDNPRLAPSSLSRVIHLRHLWTVLAAYPSHDVLAIGAGVGIRLEVVAEAFLVAHTEPRAGRALAARLHDVPHSRNPTHALAFGDIALYCRHG